MFLKEIRAGMIALHLGAMAIQAVGTTTGEVTAGEISTTTEAAWAIRIEISQALQVDIWVAAWAVDLAAKRQ